MTDGGRAVDSGIEAVYASPLERAAATARPTALALGLDVISDPRLMEINAGEFEGMLWAEMRNAYPEDAARWIAQEADYRPPGGESRRELGERGVAALRASGGRGSGWVAVVAHGGVLSAAIKSLMGVPAGRNPISLVNASLSRIRMGEPFKLETLNVTGHLDGMASRFVGDGSDLGEDRDVVV